MATTVEEFWFIENERGEIVAMVSKAKFPEHLNNIIVGALAEMLNEKLRVDTFKLIVK